MPSTSKAQQRLMGQAYAYKKGELKSSEVSAEIKELADNMTLKQLKDFASTKHAGLPETVDEAFIGPFVFNDNMSDEELLGMYNGALDGYANYTKGMHYAKSDYKKAYQEIEKILKKRGVAVDENITPANLTGMGPVVLPNNGTVGSGDVPAGSGDAKKRYKKKMKSIKTFEQFVNESYDGNISDFKYEYSMRFEEETGNSPKAIKKISKKGNGYEVRTSSYMSKQELERVGLAMGLTLKDYKKTNIIIAIYE